MEHKTKNESIRERLRTIVLSITVVFVMTSPAQAYFDAGSGTFLLQMLAAVAVGAMFYFRRAGNFLINFFRIKGLKNKTAQKDD